MYSHKVGLKINPISSVLISGLDVSKMAVSIFLCSNILMLLFQSWEAYWFWLVLACVPSFKIWG